ncbi:MAG: hypothetical protein NTY19_45130 [Planctomycetota bacterium]|nr:hypothetical protein [Planctomycetota bacterium]
MRFPTLAKQHIHRPIVAVHLQASAGRWLSIDALVDTGSDVSLFPESLARRLALDLRGVSPTPLTSALGTVATYRPVELVLELRRFPDVLRWKTTVGFLDRPMTYGLLGTKGFFEFFTMHYDARGHLFEIEPAGDLPQ